VSVDHSPPPGDGFRARVTAPLKAVIRPLVRWYVRPIVDAQREFNDTALKLIDDLYDHVEAQLDARLLRELDERVFRLERTHRSSIETRSTVFPSGPTPARAWRAISFDYVTFEARMRGSRSEIRERQRRYVELFVGCEAVVDLGCGRGEFLSLLQEAGIQARGVDSNPEMADLCLAEGLEAETRDAVGYLASLDEGSVGGIFCAQVVEHLHPDALLSLFAQAFRTLRTDGIFVVETVNPLSFVALKGYFADLTHVQPLVSETLVLIARQAGFASAEVQFVNEPAPEDRLHYVELPADPAFDPARIALAENTARLNDVVFGPQDYVLIARR
jgi:SAM-dependent methyltransferase